MKGKKYKSKMLNVDYPPHYRAHPSGVECIEITEHMSFCLGNAVKYLWRADLKEDAVQDLNKAVWYINREIKTIEATEKEKPRELIRHQYTESNQSSKWRQTHFQEGGMFSPEYNLQYNSSPENYR